MNCVIIATKTRLIDTSLDITKKRLIDKHIDDLIGR